MTKTHSVWMTNWGTPVVPNWPQDGTIITRVQPSRDNALQKIDVLSGPMGRWSQNLVLRLRNVESSEVELQLQYGLISRAQGRREHGTSATKDYEPRTHSY